MTLPAQWNVQNLVFQLEVSDDAEVLLLRQKISQLQAELLLAKVKVTFSSEKYSRQ